MNPFLLSPSTWVPIKDGDDEARAFFDRHYSRYFYKDGRRPLLFVGPGQKMVLRTPCGRATTSLSAAGREPIRNGIKANYRSRPELKPDTSTKSRFFESRSWRIE